MSGGAGAPKLLLINPCVQEMGWERYFQMAPLTLLQVAACAPPPWTVEILDETLQGATGEEECDLVGITCMTHQAPRTYALAGKYRERGIPVVLGGIHPTVLPEEASLHADAVVVGEAEPVFARLLDDAMKGALDPVYRSPEPAGDDLRIPHARRELLAGKRYLTRQVLQTTRGCPYDCPFCTVTPYFGRRYRRRPTEDVLAELAGLPGRLVIFLDDDTLSDPVRVRPLLEGLAGTGKRWAGQSTLHFAEDREFLRLVRDSGCLGLFVGVESATEGGASELPKHRRVSNRGDAVKRIQDEGILVEGSFVFGLDGDDEGVFERTVRFVEETGLCNATFHLLTPYPGTALARQFEAEGRLLHKDWARYDHNTVVYRPEGMTAERLYRGWVEARQEIHSLGSIFRRSMGMPKLKLTCFAYGLLRKGPDDRLDPDVC